MGINDKENLWRVKGRQMGTTRMTTRQMLRQILYACRPRWWHYLMPNRWGWIRRWHKAVKEMA